MDGDTDYVADEDEVDDEATLEEEELLAMQEGDYQRQQKEELDALADEADLPIEEILRRYYGAGGGAGEARAHTALPAAPSPEPTRRAPSEDRDEEEEEYEEEGGGLAELLREDLEDDSNRPGPSTAGAGAAAGATHELERRKREAETRVAEHRRAEEAAKIRLAGSEGGKDKELEGAARELAMAQPTGNTLATTRVKTKVGSSCARW